MKALKNQLYSDDKIKNLAATVQKGHPSFDQEGFCRRVHARGWKSLELKERMRRVTNALHETLSLPYAEALRVLCTASTQDRGFIYISFSDYIEVYGLEHVDTSIAALRETTRACSSELAIRPFIISHQDKTLKAMRKWVNDPDEHVRRLASEGCRPRLPWAMALPLFKADPKPIIPILKALKNDPSEYVRRSVANNLNDISKDNPQVAIMLARAWFGKTVETDRLVTHGLRTLLKQGDSDALSLLGFDAAGAEIKGLKLSKPEVAAGGDLVFSFDLKVSAPIDLRLDYAIYFLKKNGTHTRKVFRISSGSYTTNTPFKRRHSFRSMTTRTHYAGPHFLSVIINGREGRKKRFVLKD